MLERKHKRNLSLNLKNLANHVDDLNTISILQYNSCLYACSLYACSQTKGRHMITLEVFIFCDQYVLIFSVEFACSKLF